jgi:hypothetical protein
MSRTAHPRRHAHRFVAEKTVLEFIRPSYRSERRTYYKCAHPGCFAGRVTVKRVPP